MTDEHAPYRGRFAPSPTGDLHFGSLVAAVASFLDARANRGAWLIRVEDVDPPREVAGSADRILKDLERFGMSSDLAVLYQSARTQAYEVAIDSLLKSGDAYWCGCSRSDIPASGVYPGTCREGLFAGRKPRSVRLRTEGAVVRFIDRIQGHQEVDLEKSSGDFVIRRADGLPAYQLAVVVDDAFQEISEIVRGADLLDSTPRQILLQEKLGLTTPGYAHLPIAVDPKGDKLSKRLKSDPLAQLETHEALTMALEFLGQKVPPPGNLEDIWSCAIEHWNLEDVPQASERA